MLRIKIAPLLYTIFVIFILLISLFPFKHQDINVFGTHISYTDIFLLIVISILFPLFSKKLPDVRKSSKVVKYLYFILFYGLISTIWTTYVIGYWYTFYQLALTFITITIPFLISKIANDKHIDYHKMISNFSTTLSFIFLVYIFQSDNSRLGGYLGGAALIGTIMIPVIAVHFHNLVNKKRVIISLICFFITLYAIFLTESRVSLVMLLLYMTVTLLRKPTFKRIITGILLTMVFVFFLLGDLSTERYEELLFDSSRLIAFETSMAWGMHSVSSFIFGNGYGTVWQWYAFESGVLPWWHFPLHYTEYGFLLFHAHSVFNQLFAELGLIGTLPFFIIIFILIKETFVSWVSKNELKTDILIAIVCSLAGLFSDLLIFRNWETTMVWLFYLFTILNYSPKKHINPNKLTMQKAAR